MKGDIRNSVQRKRHQGHFSSWNPLEVDLARRLSIN